MSEIRKLLDELIPVAPPDLVVEKLRDVSDDVAVRPKLDAEDLRLIRRAFVGYINSGLAKHDGMECVWLFNRMFRRVQ